jgi:integrase
LTSQKIARIVAAVEWTDKRTNTPPRLQDLFLADEFETEWKRLDKDLGLAESGKLHPGHLSVAQEGLFILTGAYAGLRIGEVAGLRLGRLHLDPPNPFIEVSKPPQR